MTAARTGPRALSVRQFSDYFFSSGCRVWDASAALRWILAQEVCVAKGRDVLELGAGVGLVVGLAAAVRPRATRRA